MRIIWISALILTFITSFPMAQMVENWSYATGDTIRSSPIVNEEVTIFFGSDDRYFYAINSDGTMKWRYRTFNGINFDPAFGPQGRVFFGGVDRRIYILDPDSGDVVFSRARSSSVEGGIAVKDDGTFYVGIGSVLEAWNPSGDEYWVRDWGFYTAGNIRNTVPS